MWRSRSHSVRCAAVPSDAELIQRTADGDRSAFDDLYRRYARPVFGLALRRLGDRGRAEDAVQETFASVWRSAASYRPDRGPGAPWLYAVARNAIVDRARRHADLPAELPDRAAERARAARDGRAGLGRLARAPGARGAARARARSDRARLLERPVAERGRRVPPSAARHREDANAVCARPPRRPARGGLDVSVGLTELTEKRRRRLGRRWSWNVIGRPKVGQ